MSLADIFVSNKDGVKSIALHTQPSRDLGGVDVKSIDVALSSDNLAVELMDGRSIIVPLAWYPRLLYGTESERQNWQLLGDGYAIEWPDLDEHIGIEGLLAGRRSGESEASFSRWLASRGARP